MLVTHVNAAFVLVRNFVTTNSSGAVQTNYPLEETWDTASEISAGKMRADCFDIRVYDTNGTTLVNYALINCNTSFTSVVFIAPSLAIGTSTYFLKYSDPVITNGQTTTIFDKYEMFTATAPTCTLSGSSFWDTTNQWLRLTTAIGAISGGCNYNYSPGNTTKAYEVWFEAWAGGGTGADSTWQYSFDSSVPTAEDIVPAGGAHFTLDEYQSRECYTQSTVDNGACLATYTTTNIGNSTWKAYKLSYDPTRRRIMENGIEVINTTAGTTPTLTNTNFGFAARTGGQTNEHRIRKFAVMKFNEAVSSAPLAPTYNTSDPLGFVLRDTTDTGNYSNLCDFGDVTVSAVYTCAYRLKVTTYANNGYTLFVKTSGGMIGISGYVISDAASGAGTTIVAGIEKYGVTITAGTSTNGLITNNTLFNGAGSNADTLNYPTSQAVLTSNGPNVPAATTTTNTILVTHKMAVSGNTPGATYTQATTWTVAPNY